MTGQIVTANRLTDGVVVFLTPAAGWSDAVAEAALFDTASAAEGLAKGQADVARHIVVGAYLVDAEPGPAGPVPVEFRERIRARGPTVGVRGAFDVPAAFDAPAEV
ncbi:uncharacterized protein DUF2849 [Stella humosa]|uniref:Uncharacterized protein DUF2849 n=1 Tax=Stella humosa TaxID=94 RepID=A0A3N1KT58_9PROT|nr:DUF2849 domain-containing protein [Stella humosa]ROP81296.1 uncharacterized protein DUF2849 [Stella humosa]BBK32645.1 hypothetical protein STHU_32790 [Stella humosa]